MNPLRSQREPMQVYLPYVMKAIGVDEGCRHASAISIAESNEHASYSGSIGNAESSLQSSSSDASLPDCAQSSLDTSWKMMIV